MAANRIGETAPPTPAPALTNACTRDRRWAGAQFAFIRPHVGYSGDVNTPAPSRRNKSAGNTPRSEPRPGFPATATNAVNNAEPKAIQASTVLGPNRSASRPDEIMSRV